MSLEYLLVGVAKGVTEDYKEFYNSTRDEVYALALSIVKDRFLAREIAVETYRRVNSLAYCFDTDFDAEYWLLDMVKNLSVNAMQDKEAQKLSARRVDNLSRLLREAIMETGGERGSILILKTISSLRYRDISRLLWYHTGSLSNEYRRALRLLVSLEGSRDAASVKEELKRDISAATPDMWGLIISSEETKVSYISHEELGIEGEDVAFSEEDEENAKIRRAALIRERKKKVRTIALISSISVVLICALAATGIIIYRDKGRGGGEIEEPLIENDPQYNTRIAMVETGGVLYYQDISNGGVLASLNITEAASKPSVISNDQIKEIVADGTYIFYRNNRDGKIYRYGVADREAIPLTSGTSLALHDKWLYYSGRNGVNRILKDGGGWEEIFNTENDENLYRYEIGVQSDGTVYFSSGFGKGLHRVTDFKGTPSSEGLYLDEVYSFQIYDDRYLFFDAVLYNRPALYCVDLNTDEVRKLDNVNLNSSAVYAHGGFIYYEGYGAMDEAGNKSAIGIYRQPIDGSTAQLIIPAEDEKLSASDMYVSDSRIYCYYCGDGAQNSAKKLVSYPIEGDYKENMRIIFSVK